MSDLENTIDSHIVQMPDYYEFLAKHSKSYNDPIYSRITGNTFECHSSVPKHVINGILGVFGNSIR